MKSIKLFAIILAIGLTVSLNYKNYSVETFTLKDAHATSVEDLLEAIENGDDDKLNDLGFVAVAGSDGKIKYVSGTYYKDEEDYVEGGSNDSDDFWDDVWNSDWEQSWDQCELSSSSSGGGGLRFDENGVEISGEGSNQTNYSTGSQGSCSGGNDESCRDTICF